MNSTHKIDVYGFSAEQIQALKNMAQQRSGSKSLSAFVKDLLLAELAKQPSDNDPPVQPLPSETEVKTRLELKLPPHIAAYIHTAARQGKMSPNRRALYILAQHIEKHPILTDNEVTALYQSNVQLGAIGRNINQIARHLNAGEGTSLTQRQLAELKQIITEHVERVGIIIQEHRARQES